MTVSDLKFKKDNIIIGLIVVLLLAIIAAAVFLMISFQRKQDKTLLSFYKQLKNTNDHNEIYNIFNNMIKYRFNISLKASPRRLVTDSLSGCELADPVLEIMDYIENKKEPTNEDKLYIKGKVKEICKKLMNDKNM